jgi:phosphoserine phosphatase
MSLRLAVFDLDGTLKQARDPYVYLHRRLGTWEASQAFLERGLSGELDYDEWLRRDVALWKGVTRADMEIHFRENPYLPGARQTVRALKEAGVLVAVVSTGVQVQAEQVQVDLGLDRIFANEVLFEDGRATGLARACIPERGKGQIVAQMQAELGVQPSECLAVGDSTPDIDMFALVRVGVAVDPVSDVVRSAAHLVLETADLSPLLPRLNEMLPGWIPS